MDFLHPAMQAAFAPPAAFAPVNHLPSAKEQELCGLRSLVQSLKLQQRQNAEFMATVKEDAYRYRHLRDFFALDSGDDMRDFAELAVLTGAEFDAVVDESRAAMRGVESKKTVLAHYHAQAALAAA